LRTIFSGGPGDKELVILAHLDIDGAVTAYLLGHSLEKEYKAVHVIFTKPYTSMPLRTYLVSKYIALQNADIAMVDLSVNQISPGSTAYLLNYLDRHTNLKYVIDHHMGWPEFLKYNKISYLTQIYDHKVTFEGTGSGTLITGKTAACAELVYDYFSIDRDDEYLALLLSIAKISDDLQIRSEMISTDAYATFAGIKGEDADTVMSRLLSRNLKTNSTWYTEKTQEVQEYLSRAREVYPGIGYIQLLSDSAINRTLLCEQGYKQYKVFILSEVNSKKMKITYTIATTLDNVNLVDMFSLRSGCPKKISVCRKHIDVDYIVNQFKPYLSGKEVTTQ
jgi:hypothetical protein